MTFGELDSQSNRVAHLMRARGIGRGDSIAIFASNSIEFLVICSAAARAGVFFTPIATGLTSDEARYIAEDCSAKAFFSDEAHGDRAIAICERSSKIRMRISINGDVKGFERLDDALARMPATPIADESLGQQLLYSSGTTGRPKGVRLPLPTRAMDADDEEAITYFSLFGIDGSTVYLSPAPLYHAAPLRFALSILSIGATVIVMEKFDAEKSLALIQEHRVTHSQWVPTMFVRMLSLQESVRGAYDLSSHRVAIHGAAPCPPDAKRAMIKWWGPILYEYYGGTEGIGSCAITSEEWLNHPGSVGRPKLGNIHILDENGRELGPNKTGFVYFSGGPQFEYLHRKEDTDAITSRSGARTFGDVGHLDEDGYLYLTDRASNLIISGGVNIYPQETENLLLAHPEVADAAVFGVPNPDFGEEVKAIVQPVDWGASGDELAKRLIEYCKQNLAAVKCPRSIDFEKRLPRQENGKLYKRLLRDKYWSGRQSQLV